MDFKQILDCQKYLVRSWFQWTTHNIRIPIINSAKIANELSFRRNVGNPPNALSRNAIQKAECGRCQCTTKRAWTEPVGIFAPNPSAIKGYHRYRIRMAIGKAKQFPFRNANVSLGKFLFLTNNIQ